MKIFQMNRLDYIKKFCIIIILTSRYIRNVYKIKCYTYNLFSFNYLWVINFNYNSNIDIVPIKKKICSQKQHRALIRVVDIIYIY